MSQYTEFVQNLKFNVKKRIEIEQVIKEKETKLSELENELVDMLEALGIISTISDETTTAVLDYITGIINKALAEIFPYDTRRIFLRKDLYKEQYTHINVILEDGAGHQRSLTLQSGTGLRQIVSFLFVLSLIEIRKGRPILLMDELLSGLHPSAKCIIEEIIKIFAEEGFQFVMVEYGLDKLGKIYLVEKPKDGASVTPLGDDNYNGEIFKFNKPEEFLESALQEEFIDE